MARIAQSRSCYRDKLGQMQPMTMFHDQVGAQGLCDQLQTEAGNEGRYELVQTFPNAWQIAVYDETNEFVFYL